LSLLCIYTHGEGVVDIEKNEAEKMVKKAFLEYCEQTDTKIS
jgi:hypothetical protein